MNNDAAVKNCGKNRLDPQDQDKYWTEKETLFLKSNILRFKLL
ncbi:MAG: hypothetical protein OEZ24_02685 [Candidatus Bathyarchaeota archaeon]|nr:hypothetical protein [Candidatus Bathyarchaeota archaeon]